MYSSFECLTMVRMRAYLCARGYMGVSVCVLKHVAHLVETGVKLYTARLQIYTFLPTRVYFSACFKLHYA
jgi:hypothetical protein